MLKGKNILVTGSTGLIGQALVDELLVKNECNLRLQARDARQARSKFGHFADTSRVNIVECDFAKCSDLDIHNLSKDCDIIIHLAGLVHKPDAQYQDYELLNVRVTDQLVRGAENNQVDTFLFLSSSAVYGNGPFSSVDEAAPLKGETPYAVSKIVCEQILPRPSLAMLGKVRPPT